MAAAESTIVFLPRFTTFAGAGEYITQPLDVSQFASAQFQFGRAVSSGELRLYLEESLDSVEWTLGASAPKGVLIASACVPVAPTSWPVDPTANTEAQYEAELRKRWFRVELVLTGTNPAVTCWAVGFLERRES